MELIQLELGRTNLALKVCNVIYQHLLLLGQVFNFVLNATIVAVFKVNPMFGTRVLYRAYTKEGRDKINDGLDVGLFTQNSANNADVVRLMASEIPCGHYKAAQSEMGLWYIAKAVEVSPQVGSLGFQSAVQHLLQWQSGQRR